MAGDQAMTAREEHLVELVDTGGQPTGSATVEQAHREPGQLHRAFSVFLRDADGRVLLQQRAAVKTRFPLRWANTCCGHPTPGEAPAVAARRRLVEELGITDVTLAEVGVYSYYAEDPATGRVEYEYDHVLLGDLPADRTLRPDPDEVADCRWIPVPALLAEVENDPRSYAPWLAGVTRRLAEHLAGAPVDSPTASPHPDAGPDVKHRTGQEAAERSGGR